MNYISQLNSFWEQIGQQRDIRPSARIVYMALLQINNECGWKTKFQAVYGMVLSMTGIANAKTYYSALEELVNAGLINWEKGPNQYRAATFEIKVLYQKTDEQVQSKVKASSKLLDEQVQSKVNIPKQVNIKPKTNKQFIPPSVNEVCQYFEQKGYSKELAQRAFDYYEAGDWKDSEGKQVRSWRQKMNGVWFKDENRVKNGSTSKMVY